MALLVPFGGIVEKGVSQGTFGTGHIITSAIGQQPHFQRADLDHVYRRCDLSGREFGWFVSLLKCWNRATRDRRRIGLEDRAFIGSEPLFPGFAAVNGLPKNVGFPAGFPGRLTLCQAAVAAETLISSNSHPAFIHASLVDG